MSEDPFDDIDPDAYRDREGDPVDSLKPADAASDESTEQPDGETPADTGSTEQPDGEAPADTGSTEQPDGETPADTGGEADPFEYVDDRPAGEGRDGDGRNTADASRQVDVAGDAFGDVDVSRGDPFEGPDSAFQQVDVDSVDPDAVWDRFIEHADERDHPHGGLGGEGVPDDVPDTVTVPKGRFCQTCPHFSAPPDIGCTHEGTEIVKFVDSDEVRVSNCPIVAKRRELGETYE